MEPSKLLLALLGSAVVVSCSGDSSDSNGGSGGESDADTDTDTDTDTDADADADTDTDTDTDPAMWDADAVVLDAAFGYERATGTIKTTTYLDTTMPNRVLATVVNLDDIVSGNDLTHFCYFEYEIPEGAIATNGDFDDTHWLSFDLSAAVVTYGDLAEQGVDGDCEHLRSFMGTPTDGQDLSTFGASLGIGFGMKSFGAVDAATAAVWEKDWPSRYAATVGGWNQVSGAFAAGAFTVQGGAPTDLDIVLGYAVDTETWSITADEKTGAVSVVTLTNAQQAQTAYYATLSMYTLTE